MHSIGFGPRAAGLRALLFFLLSVTPLLVRADARTQSACAAFAAAAGPPPPCTHSSVHISAMSSHACRFVCVACAQKSCDGSAVYYSTTRAVLIHIGRSYNCYKEHKGYARVALTHRSTDLEPGGTGTAGPWPPAQPPVLNPSPHVPGDICMLNMLRCLLHMLRCPYTFDIGML